MKNYIVLLATCILSMFAVAHSNCDTKWTEFNGHCYRYFNYPRKNFTMASDFCKTLKEKAHIIHIESGKEDDFIIRWWKSVLPPLNGETPQYLLTGLIDVTGVGQFTWSDGTDATFTKFDKNQADKGNKDEGNCAVVTVSKRRDKGDWVYAKCSNKYSFMCEHTCTTCEKPK